MRGDISEVVFQIVADQAMVPVDRITLATAPDELGMDSLGLVEAIFAIEEAFDIAVPFNANETGPSEFDFSTIGSVVAAVQALIAAKTL